jgi:putative transposase
MARAPKKRGAEQAHIVLIDETGLLLNPLVRRTLAPCGQTPSLPVTGGTHRKVSVIAGLSLSPIAHHLGLYFRTVADGYFNNVGVADFVRELLRHLRGKVIVVWDNGRMHKGDPIRQLLADYPRLSLAYLPPYAPDLNPVEQLWNYLKYGQLANYVPQHLQQLDDRVVEILVDAKFDPGRLQSCYNNTPLIDAIRTLDS